MTNQVDIIEVGPRDGLQSEPEILPTETKIEFVKRSLDAGIRHLEVASFVHPKKVPQMADAEAVLAGLPRDRGANYIGLIVNWKGFERAVAAGVHEVGMVVVASDTFSKRNQGVPTKDSLPVWSQVAEATHGEGLRPSVTIGAAFGCPFEGEVPVQRVVDLAKRVAEDRPVQIGIADTIGVAVPGQVAELIGALSEAVPEIPIRCHFHNTRNTGLANAQAAITAGVAALDSSTGGIGGCPFAPAATGNIPTDDLVYMLNRSGVETGVDLDKVIENSHWLAGELGRGVPAMLPKAGIFPDNVVGTAA